MNQGNIPVLYVSGRTLPEAWEKSVLETWERGARIKTEYDKPEDPQSRDCTMMLAIEEPFSEPRLHRNFPAGLEELEIYRQEVVDGIHDHWICPEEGKWTYTYHKRLFCYEVADDPARLNKKCLFASVNQVEHIIDKLALAPHSRRAQAITWIPNLDPETDDPPCLQRLWCRLAPDGNGGWVLNLNSHWRSRDAYKAAFMNIFALTDLQRIMAARLAERMKAPVSAGRYVDVSDSYHIYGSYFKEFEGFLKAVASRTFEQRVWTTEFCEPFFQEARKKLAADVDFQLGR